MEIRQFQCALGRRPNQITPGTRDKLRRSCKRTTNQQLASDLNWREDRQKTPLGDDNPKGFQTKYFTKAPEKACAYYLKSGNGSKNTDGVGSSYNSCVAKNNLAVRNYLNQKPSSRVEEQNPSLPCRTRNISDYQMVGRSNAANIEKQHRSTNFPPVGNNRTRSNPVANRCNVVGTHSKHVADGSTNSEIKLASIRDSPVLNSYNQSHGVLTASAYNDLRNGIIRW